MEFIPEVGYITAQSSFHAKICIFLHMWTIFNSNVISVAVCALALLSDVMIYFARMLHHTNLICWSFKLQLTVRLLMAIE